MRLSDLKSIHVSELVKMATTNDIEGANRMRKQDLVFALLKNQARKGESIFGEGTLEILQDGFGFLRSPDTSYLAGPDDIYISPSQIRRFNLHTGDSVDGEIRPPKEGERYFALVKIDKVNNEPPENSKRKILFENLTPLFPTERLTLEREIKSEENITGRRCFSGGEGRAKGNHPSGNAEAKASHGACVSRFIQACGRPVRFADRVHSRRVFVCILCA